MNRISYVLSALVLPLPNQPGWAELLTTSTQSVMDAEYLKALDNFYGQAEGWMQTQTIKRGSNAAYVPDPFKIAIPRRQLVAYDANGDMAPYFAEADPNIHLPELPPLPAPSTAPPPPAFKMATPPDQVMAQMLGAMMAKLLTLERKLDAALAAK
jgi:hypothetical protein